MWPAEALNTLTETGVADNIFHARGILAKLYRLGHLRADDDIQTIIARAIQYKRGTFDD